MGLAGRPTGATRCGELWAQPGDANDPHALPCDGAAYEGG